MPRSRCVPSRRCIANGSVHWASSGQKRRLPKEDTYLYRYCRSFDGCVFLYMTFVGRAWSDLIIQNMSIHVHQSASTSMATGATSLVPGTWCFTPCGDHVFGPSCQGLSAADSQVQVSVGFGSCLPLTRECLGGICSVFVGV